MDSAYVSEELFMNLGSSTLISYPSDLTRQNQHFSVGFEFPWKKKT